jgi:hypothetical protein
VEILKKIRKILIITVTLVLTLASVTGAVFADIDYSQWNSMSAYPSDVVGTQLFPAVKALIDKKVLSGYPDGTFKAQNNITRAEIAVALTKMTNNTSGLDAMAKKNVFNDLAGYDWAKGYINAAANVGYIKGITASSFAPGKNISYAELITMIIRTKASASELDAYGSWPNNYILYAQTYNMLGDVSVVNWNASATRGDAAKLLYRNMPKSATAAADGSLNKSSISAAAGAATLSVSSGSNGVTTTYQWYKNSVAIPGATTNNLSIPAPVAGDKYYVIIKTKEIGYSETTVTSNTCTVGP